MEDIIPEEFKRIKLIYSIEDILSIGEGSITLLNNFREYYEKLEVKPIDISTFKKNNYGKGSAVRSRNGGVNGSWKRKNRFRGKDIEKFFINLFLALRDINSRPGFRLERSYAEYDLSSLIQ